MGYIEETGAAQYLRDARITTIYEGTTGIQATDLVLRKVLRDRGAGIRTVIGSIRALDAELAPVLPVLSRSVAGGAEALESAVTWLLEANTRDPRLPLAASVPFLELTGIVLGGYELARAALRAHAMLDQGSEDKVVLQEMLEMARFYLGSILPDAAARLAAMRDGAPVLLGSAEPSSADRIDKPSSVRPAA
jgi:hypothetical protein